MSDTGWFFLTINVFIVCVTCAVMFMAWMGLKREELEHKDKK